MLKSKYNSRKVTRNGETYDSIKEADRHGVLKLLERAGKISNLQRQVKFELIPAQKDPVTGKVIEWAVSYVADFVYDVPVHTQSINENGHVVFGDGWKTIVEDVKGYRTPEYKLKKKMMLYLHNIRIKET